MRKSLVCFLILAVLGAAALTAVGVGLHIQGEQVSVETTVFAGDLSAAQNVQVSYEGLSGEHLHWDVELHLGAEPTVDAEFDYVLEQTYDSWEQPLCEFVGNSSRSGGSHLYMVDLVDAQRQQLFEQTEPGTTRTQTVQLQESGRYYPVSLRFYAPAGEDGQPELFAEWNATSYLSVPIPPELTVEITISKGENGMLEQEETSPGGRYYVAPHAVLTERGIYLVVELRQEDGSPLPGGGGDNYGVHFLPFTQSDGQSELRRLQTGMAQRVYAVDPDAVTAGLFAGKDGTLRLITEERGTIFLTVLDPETGETLDRMEMGTGWAHHLWAGENFVAVMTDGSELLSAVTDGGPYEPGPRGDLSGFLDMEAGMSQRVVSLRDFNGATALWDGQRLVVVGMPGWPGDAMSLLVCGQEGLRCAAKVWTSLSDGSSMNYWDNCRPIALEAPGGQVGQ